MFGENPLFSRDFLLYGLCWGGRFGREDGTNMGRFEGSSKLC